MKIFVGLVFLIGVVAYSLAQILRTRREQSDSVSEAWLTEREVRDAITQGQFDGVTIQFPINRRA